MAKHEGLRAGRERLEYIRKTSKLPLSWYWQRSQNERKQTIEYLVLSTEY